MHDKEASGSTEFKGTYISTLGIDKLSNINDGIFSSPSCILLN
jgi:hypothetical protein